MKLLIWYWLMTNVIIVDLLKPDINQNDIDDNILLLLL